MAGVQFEDVQYVDSIKCTEIQLTLILGRPQLPFSIQQYVLNKQLLIGKYIRNLNNE